MNKQVPKKKTKRRQPSSWGYSSWSKLQKETLQDYELRKPIIQKIRDYFGCLVYVFFTTFSRGQVGICDYDAEILENVLSVEHDGKRLLLIINSPGGQALACERIANICRAYSNNNFDVLVPHMAKSGATLIAFGANKIYMSKTAELGPVDPQIQYNDNAGDPVWTSAAEYIRAYDKLMKKGTMGNVKRLEPILHQLQYFDPREIEAMRSHQDLSEDISIKLLKSGMMKRISKKAISKRIKPFLSQKEKSAHGRMIGYDESKKCGLKVEPIDLYSLEWDQIWELHVRCDWVMKNRSAALIETSNSSLHRRIKRE